MIIRIKILKEIIKNENNQILGNLKYLIKILILIKVVVIKIKNLKEMNIVRIMEVEMIRPKKSL